MSERLSKNFARREFSCQCGCGFDAVDWQLIESLQMVRDVAGKPVSINSGSRCAEHNSAVGGKPNSQHLTGKAADIQIAGYTTHMVEAIVKAIPAFTTGGIGRYKTFVHCDVRNTGMARWSK